MAVILAVTTTPSTFANGAWPATAMNTAKWKVTFTPSNTVNEYALLTASGTGTGGLWRIGGAIELYSNTDALLVSRPITTTVGVPVTITVDPVLDQITIAGAASGNGTFSVTNASLYFVAGSALAVGSNGAAGYVFPGTISSIEDFSSSSITATAAITRTQNVLSASGTLSNNGTATSTITPPVVSAVAAGAPISGTAAITRTQDVVSAAGSLSVNGSCAGVLQNNVVTALQSSPSSVILEVVATPSTFATGLWPATKMNTEKWKFSFTPSTSTSYGPLVTQNATGIGGIWVFSQGIEIYSATDALLGTYPITMSGGVPVLLIIDPVLDQVTISGATTGNGTFSLTNATSYFDSATTLAIGTNGAGTNFAGTVSSFEDFSVPASITGESSVSLSVPTISATSVSEIVGSVAISVTQFSTSALPLMVYQSAPFESFEEYPSGQQLQTNFWAFGAPLIVKDRSFGEIICPVRSANGQVYLVVSEDKGQNWRFVARTGGGADPLSNHTLYSCVQSADGFYHLLSGDGNDGVTYSRLALVRDGSDVITSYTRSTGALAVFGGQSVEHVAMMTVGRDQSGTECLIASMQAAPGGAMAIYAAKTLTTTPTSSAAFTKLDGTSGYTTLISGLGHNDHEHVTYHSYLSDTGDIVFFRAHSTAEGFKTGTGYEQIYHIRAQYSGANTWSIGSWQTYSAGQGVHLRGVCQSTNTVYLLGNYSTTGVTVDSWNNGVYTKSAIPQPPSTAYSDEIDGCMSCSSDGLRIFVHIVWNGPNPNTASYFACYEKGAWTKTNDQNAPWWQYGSSASTGDDFGIYAVRADGTYGDTTPTIGGYYITEPSLEGNAGGRAVKFFVVQNSLGNGGGANTTNVYALGSGGLAAAFPSATVVNASHNGTEGTGDLLYSYYSSEVLAAKDTTKRNIILFREGVNSVFYDNETGAQMLATYQAYCERARADGFEIFVGTNFPLGYDAGDNAHIQTLNTGIRAASWHDGVIDVGALPQFSPPGPPNVHYFDDTHPNDLGYQVDTAYWVSRIKQLAEGPKVGDFSSSASGTVGFVSTSSPSLASNVASASGGLSINGVAAPTLANNVPSVIANIGITSVSSVLASEVSVNSSGSLSISSSSALLVPQIATSTAGGVENNGASSPSIATQQANASGALSIGGSVAAQASGVVASLSGTQSINATSGVIQNENIVVSSGQVGSNIVGNSIVASSPFAVASLGKVGEDVTGAVAASLPAPALASSGQAGSNITGSVVVANVQPSVSSLGTLSIGGTADAALPSHSGVVQSSVSIEASSDSQLSAPNASVSAIQSIQAIASLNKEQEIVSASGSVANAEIGGVATSAIALQSNSTGALGLFGSSDAQIPTPGLVSSGTVGNDKVGIVSANNPIPVAASAGSLSIGGVATANLASFATDVVSKLGQDITGSITISVHSLMANASSVSNVVGFINSYIQEFDIYSLGDSGFESQIDGIIPIFQGIAQGGMAINGFSVANIPQMRFAAYDRVPPPPTHPKQSVVLKPIAIQIAYVKDSSS